MPLRDTWSEVDTAGYWVIRLRDVRDETNRWAAEIARNSIESFSGLAAPVSVNFSTVVDENVPMAALDREDTPPQEFAARIYDAMLRYPAPIFAANLNVETIAYVCTEDSPDVPVRMPLNLGDHFRISPRYGSEETAQVSFTLEHTLFSPYNLEGDNRLLYLLNQPLLENALRQWERAIGAISEWIGAEGVYRYGFKA